MKLRDVADALEWARAEEAIRTIEQRGFARGRSLGAARRELRGEPRT